MDLTHCRLTVVAKQYWRAFSQQKKLVEFRSGNQSTALTEGMHLLFSLNATERRRGNTDLICAEVLTVIRLTCAQACARFPVEAHACNLPQLCSNWRSDTVNCIVVKKNSLHRTKRLVNLAQGNLGILRQFMYKTGSPRFCHIDDLDRTLTVTSNTGKTETCSFHATWPTASNTRRARSAPAGAGGSERAVETTLSVAGCSPLQRQDSFTDDRETLDRAYTRTKTFALLKNCLESNTVQEFKTMAKDCPVIRSREINRQIESVLELNAGNSISLQALYKLRQSASSKGSTLVFRTIQYVANLVAVSVFLDGAIDDNLMDEWRKKFHPWVMKTFRPECIRLLPKKWYFGDHWDGGENPLEEAVVSFGLHVEPGVHNQQISFPSKDWRCDKCLAEFTKTHRTALACKCGIALCTLCFGVEDVEPKQGRGRRAAVRTFVCERCLEKHTGGSKEPCKDLLIPDHSSKLCSCCGCDMMDPYWSACPARCRLCCRLFCEREVATCQLDTEVLSTATSIGCKGVYRLSQEAKPLESLRMVASIECLFCIGRPEYLENRKKVFKRLTRKVDVSVDPLELQVGYKLRRDVVQRNFKDARAVGDFVYDLHYGGFREVSRLALDFLMQMLSVQVVPDQNQTPLRPSVSAFNMLHLLGQHPLANARMLEMVCRAHAYWAEKEGTVLLRKIGHLLQPLNPLGASTRKRVGFYGEHLFKAGPLNDLIAEAIVLFSTLYPCWEVFVFGVSSDYAVDSDLNHPPVKQLWEHFEPERRICFEPAVDAEAKLKRLREATLDVFIALPGWTGTEDLGKILYCKAAPVQFNYLEFASPMHAPALVDFTILGQAVGDEQRRCVVRERLGVIESPGTYQPMQSRALLDAVHARPSKKDRAFWNLPSDNFILLVAGSTNRLDFGEKSVHPYWAMMRRISGSILIFPDKPSGMRSYILKCLAEYNASQEASHQVDPSRIIFQEWIHDKGDFWELIAAVGLEGGRGTTICTFGSVCFHTGAGDAFMNCVTHYTCRYPNGTMQQRVAAEIATAVGLEWPCVSDSPEATVDAVVAYAHDWGLQDRIYNHMKRAQETRAGFYDAERAPRFLAHAVDTACAQVMAAGGDRSKLTDFNIPFEGRAMEALSPEAGAASAEQLRYSLLAAAGMTVELYDNAATMLQGIEEETGCTLIALEGVGASTLAIRARFPTEEKEAVIKISKDGCLPARAHNRPLFREAKCLAEWHDAMKKHAFCNLLPRPFKVLKGGCFFGHSLPNDDGEVVFFLICERIARSYRDVAQRHQDNWQQHGLMEDSFRIEVLQPMCQGMFWAQNNDVLRVIFRDWKPDNVRFRPDGTAVIVDLGSSATARVRRGAGQQAVFVERRATSKCSDAGARRGCGLLRGQPPRLGDKYVAILQAAIEVFSSRAGDRGLALIGGTTPGFRDDEQREQAKLWRFFHTRILQHFDQKQGGKQDVYALFRTVLYTLTHQRGVAIDVWDAQAKAAAIQGAPGIKGMLLDAAPPGTRIRQTLALERLVDFLHGGLCPECSPVTTVEGAVCTMDSLPKRARLDIMRAMIHEVNTVAILTPDQEEGLSKGLLFPYGPLRRAVQWPEGFLNSLKHSVLEKVEAAVIPQLAAKCQPEMGVGLLALEDVPGNTLLGVYVGRKVRNHQRGTVYDAREYPSRYNVTGQGKIKILSQLNLETKFTCDAQPTSPHDFDWCKIQGNSGPCMNASDSEAKANCMVDRHSAWYDEDTGLIWMLVWSKPARIKKGQYCMWYYDHTAGAGNLWHFRAV